MVSGRININTGQLCPLRQDHMVPGRININTDQLCPLRQDHMVPGRINIHTGQLRPLRPDQMITAEAVSAFWSGGWQVLQGGQHLIH